MPVKIYILQTEWFLGLKPIQNRMSAWKTHLHTKLMRTTSHGASGQFLRKELVRIQILLINLLQRGGGNLKAKRVEYCHSYMLWKPRCLFLR